MKIKRVITIVGGSLLSFFALGVVALIIDPEAANQPVQKQSTKQVDPKLLKTFTIQADEISKRFRNDLFVSVAPNPGQDRKVTVTLNRQAYEQLTFMQKIDVGATIETQWDETYGDGSAVTYLVDQNGESLP